MKTLFLLLLACLLFPLGAQAACTVDALATIPLQVTDGAIIVPVQVNGITAPFILDTGAQRSVVTQAAAQSLDLVRDQWVGTTMGGVGGMNSRPNADPRSLSLGGVKLFRRTLNHDTSLTVGVLPRTRVGNQVIDGLLGRDYLSMFDLDLDMPRRRVTLYRVRDCSGRFLPGSGNYASIPVTMPDEDAIVVPVTLDGTKLSALLDTGAGTSLLAAPGIFKVGLRPPDLAGDPTAEISGVGPRVRTVHRHRFRTLTVGDVTIDSPLIWVEPVRLIPIVDMLLGVDWLAGRRVWVSYSTRQLFVANR